MYKIETRRPKRSKKIFYQRTEKNKRGSLKNTLDFTSITVSLKRIFTTWKAWYKVMI
nr:hypothetical protein [Elizabethkingia bruuniana]